MGVYFVIDYAYKKLTKGRKRKEAKKALALHHHRRSFDYFFIFSK